MAGSAPTFTCIVAGLYRLSSSDDPGMSGYWAGYRPSKRSTFGDTATLDQVWQDVGGVYLFLNQTPADGSIFLASLDALLPNLSPTGAVRCLWLANPNDSPGYWQIRTLSAIASGAGATMTWQASRQASFALGSYALVVEAGAVLTQADAARLGYGIAIDAAHLWFFGPGKSYSAANNSAWLPLAGPALGTWLGALTLSNGGAPLETDPDDLTRLGVQLCYALPTLDDPIGGTATAIAMPILSQAGQSLTLFLSFDPLNPLLPARTQLSFFAPDGSGDPPALTSTLVTTRGEQMSLTPLLATAPLWNARLVFCFSPLYVMTQTDPAYANYYLAPDGAFALSLPVSTILADSETTDSITARLMLGLSGVEYVGLFPSSGALALFQAGQPAYAPSVRSTLPHASEDEPGPLLTSHATTAYVTFLPATPGATGLTYFAQPQQAPLFVGGSRLGPGFMDFHEMPAALLPSYAVGQPLPTTLPLGTYLGIDPTLAEAAQVLEQAALAPARRAAVGLPTATPLAGSAEESAQPFAVTPQGLVATLSPDGTQWAGVVVANMSASQQQLAFTKVGPAFQAALQSNELFFVVSNVDVFMAASSVSYQLDPANLPLLAAAGVPSNVVNSLTTLLQGMQPPYPVFANEQDFITVIQSVAGQYMPQILSVAGLLKASIEGWTFQLSPRSWRTDQHTPTIMIFKYCARSLEEMAKNAAAWGWPQAAQNAAGELQPTQRMIQQIFTSAASAAPGTPYARFYHDVVRNPAWNGILLLNAPVAIAEFPQALQFLTAGVDTSRFYAHHVGFAVTPFNVSPTITLGQTAVFGLIDYQDPQDLTLSATTPFAFKTLALTARFANAALADFSAQVELMVNHLFGVELTKIDPQRGNNLVLNGSYQRQNDAPSYAFTLQGTHVYTAARSALASIEVLGAQLQTATATGSASSVVVDFVLSGNLRFVELEHFDLFSYGQESAAPPGKQPADGYLRYGNLVVRMSFPLATTTQQTFSVTEDRLSFDLANSQARPRALAANFPLRLSGLISSPNLAPPGDPPEGQRPEDLGYTSIAAPIDQSLLSPPWYGLIFSLDLGSLGALAGSVGLSVSLLAAWAPGITDDDRPIYLALQLPNASALGVGWPIQGVLRLGFRSFQFEANDDQQGRRAYMLRLRRFALSILGWSFPPGNTDVFLFGNPSGDGKAALGWYAAYDAGKQQKPKPTARRVLPEPRRVTARRLQSGRRVPPKVKH